MRRNFNLPEDVVEYLQTKDNMSAYLTRLIRNDMGNNNLDNKIRKIVNEILKEKNISVNNISIDDSIGDSVKNILNL